MAEPKVTLEPLSHEEFADYVRRETQRYAEEKVRAGNWPPGGALERAKKEFDGLLPLGLETPDNFLFRIRAREEPEPVGLLWICVKHPDEGPGGFVYDLQVHERFRKKGYATAAMRELENFARQRGLPRISLHVFEHNVVAIRLYEKLNYRTTNRRMSKELVTSK
jgi:ribosomal protein S18 acetylase RimI-like enzyme